MKKKKVIVDADYLVHQCTEGQTNKRAYFPVEGESIKQKKKYKPSLKPFKKQFKQMVKDLEDEIAVAVLGKYKLKGKPILVFSDKSNFRYDIYPEYKANRKGTERTPEFYRLLKWAKKNHRWEPNTEADDVCAYYVREKRYLGASFDKDLLKGCSGIWFDVYHSRRHIVETSEFEARNFNLLQTITGDTTDNIKGISGVAEKTALKLLDKYGWHWDGVVKSYKEKGLTEKDAILTRRLICMRQWSPKKGVKLWKPKKRKLK